MSQEQMDEGKQFGYRLQLNGGMKNTQEGIQA